MNSQTLTVLICGAALFVLSLWLVPDSRLVPVQGHFDVNSERPVAPIFQQQSLDSGLIFSHLQLTDHLGALTETLGSGGCVLDFDNDGLMDLFLVGGSGHTRFYGKHSWWHRAKGHGLYQNVTEKIDQPKFENVSEKSGIVAESWGMGCAAGDLNNDGLDDLLITNKGRNLLYRNNGDGRFVNVSDISGLGETRWSTSAVMVDFDGDGLLDIYITNYIDFEKGAVTFEAARGFKSQKPESFRAELFDAQPNRLYHNQGDFKFIQRAEELGVDNSAGRSLAASWLDVDNDFDPDLLVINDRGSPSRLFLNQGGRFSVAGVEMPLDLGVENSAGSHSVIIGDWDNNTELDLVITSSGAQANKVLMSSDSGAQYRDISWDSGLAQDSVLNLEGWGGVSADFNNDGFLDLLINHGLTVPDSDSHAISQGQGARLWLNGGDGLFGVPEFQLSSPDLNSVGSSQWPLLSGRAVLKADFDNDGDMDVVLLQNNEPSQLMVNRGISKLSEVFAAATDISSGPKSSLPRLNTGGWLGVALTDKFGNASGTGASIWLEKGERVFFRSSAEQYGFLTRNDSRFHFGLGLDRGDADSSQVDKVRIQWADGQLSEISNVPMNQYISIRQGVSGYEDFKFSPVELGVAISAENLTLNWRGHPSDYWKWKLRIDSSARPVDEIHQFLSSVSFLERMELYQALLQDGLLDRQQQLVSVAMRALNEPEQSAQVIAINWLKKAELEFSVPSLLRYLSSDSDEVVCAVARAFEFYFREEEAVVIRKYLSLPPLIRLLEHDSENINICVLSALRESEHYRAIEPVSRLLYHSSKEARIAAIRTLGRLRHIKVEQALLDILARHDAEVEEKSEVLIALSRLNSMALDGQIGKQLSANWQVTKGNNNSAQAFSKSLALLNAVLKNANGVVILDKVLTQFARLWTPERVSALSPRLEGYSAAILNDLYQVVASNRDIRLFPLVKIFIQHERADIRLEGYKSLSQFRSKESDKLLAKAFNKESIQIQKALLDFYRTSSFSLPMPIDGLIKQANQHPELLSSLLPLLKRQHGQVALSLIRKTLAVDSYSDEIYLAALEACQRFPLSNISINRKLKEHNSVNFLAHTLACEMTQESDKSKLWQVSQEQTSGLSRSIDDLLKLDQSETIVELMETLSRNAPDLARKLLINLTKSRSLSARTIVGSLNVSIENHHDSFVLPILTASLHTNPEVRLHGLVLLNSYLDKPGVVDRMWQVLEHAKEPIANRLLVAEALYSIDPQRVALSLEI